MKRKIIALSVFMSVGLIAGCGQERTMESMQTEIQISPVEEEKENIQTEELPEETKVPEQITITEQPEPTPQVLHYIDAWEEWHDTVIREDVRKHLYDWKYLKNDRQEISYDGDENYTLRKGVDVSHHQGTIDWNKVKAAGYDFAIVRMAYRGYGQEGSLQLDREYLNYIRNAQNAGMEVGVYVFSQAINEAEALEEAELVLTTLKEQGITLELPIVFDPENIRDAKARTDDVTGEQFTKNTIAFCEKVKEAGYEPMVYSNMIWEADLLDLAQLSEYKIWYADYELVPQTPYDFQFWQFTEKGQVDGINGIVDLDVWFVPKDTAQ